MRSGWELAKAILAAALLAACGSDDASTTSTGAGGGAAAGGQGGASEGGGGGAPVMPTVVLPKVGLEASEIAILVNDQDPQSVAVASYYQSARGIPADHVYTVSFAPGGNVLAPEDFAPLKEALDLAVAPGIQAYAITWTQPYRVGCMAITAAFALGFDTKWCNTTGTACGPTAPSPYYGSSSFAPFTDHGIRPAMALVGVTAEDVEALIDRGLAAEATFPNGDGYLYRTTDPARSVRWMDFLTTLATWDHPGEGLRFSYVDNSEGSGSNQLEDASDVLFYFTGLADVPGIESNSYRPGAIADHLTSYGGQVPTSGQMSITRWLEAGVTGSYGTVVEPCNYLEKFPNTNVVVPHYYRGQSLIEAYWKSVMWPGEGMFVGDPLARPWGHAPVKLDDGVLTIETTSLEPGKSYEVVAGPTDSGPFEVVLGAISVPHHQLATIAIEPATERFYVLRAVP